MRRIEGIGYCRTVHRREPPPPGKLVEHLITFQGFLPERQGQYPDSIVLYMRWSGLRRTLVLYMGTSLSTGVPHLQLFPQDSSPPRNSPAETSSN